jgi:hypothetical protein
MRCINIYDDYCLVWCGPISLLVKCQWSGRNLLPPSTGSKVEILSSSKCQHSSTGLHNIASQKTVISIYEVLSNHFLTANRYELTFSQWRLSLVGVLSITDMIAMISGWIIIHALISFWRTTYHQTLPPLHYIIYMYAGMYMHVRAHTHTHTQWRNRAIYQAQN